MTKPLTLRGPCGSCGKSRSRLQVLAARMKGKEKQSVRRSHSIVILTRGKWLSAMESRMECGESGNRFQCPRTLVTIKGAHVLADDLWHSQANAAEKSSQTWCGGLFRVQQVNHALGQGRIIARPDRIDTQGLTICHFAEIRNIRADDGTPCCAARCATPLAPVAEVYGITMKEDVPKISGICSSST